MVVETKQTNVIKVPYKPTPSARPIDLDDSRSLHSLMSCMSNFSSITSLCRICQSETGTMIRPCACAGTMGKIHEKCLNEWVMHSKKECCEICQADYAKSGNAMLPLREWKKPKFTSSNWVELASLAGLLYSIIYLILIFGERQFLRRLFVDGLPPREPDVCRTVLLCMMLVFLVSLVSNLTKKVKFYLRRQYKVRFINSLQYDNNAGGGGAAGGTSMAAPKLEFIEQLNISNV